MAQDNWGGFEYRGQTYRFIVADCHLVLGNLSLGACGDDRSLDLPEVPFPGALNLSDLPGRARELDEAWLRLHRDNWAGVDMGIGSRDVAIMGGRVECRRFDRKQNILTIYFRLTIQEDESEQEDEIDGVAHCHCNPA